MSLHQQQWKPVVYILALSMILSIHASPVLVSRPATVETAPCSFPSLMCGDATTGSFRCLQLADICDGTKQCASGSDEINCDVLSNYILSPSVISARDIEEDTVIENVSREVCAKLCGEQDRFTCKGFQHNFHSHHCRLLDANFTRTKSKPLLRSFWLTFITKEKEDPKLDGHQQNASTPIDEPKKGTQHSGIPLHGFEGGFDAIIVDADFSSLPSERPKRKASGLLSRSAGSCGKRNVEFDPPLLTAKRNGRVVGGVDAPIGAYPWQVAIKRKDETQPWCGGAIIDDRFVLTAAHCIDHFHRKGREFVVVVGEHDLQSVSPNEQVFEVENFITYPNYRSSKSGDDIALIKLQTVDDHGIVFNDHVQPICLPSSEQAYQPGTVCSVTGWGMQKANDRESVPQVLQAASVPILSGETCISKDVYGNFLSSDHFPESMICAGYLEGKTDACSGDSGGPLACHIDGQFQLLGLVSWGDDQPGGCASANKPGVYTKILRFVDWIHEWSNKL